ncbi:MAG: PriCT-2 domain-containing protein, partial [Burkholderiales bacterium]|nr:PriCT-2 domain-containing protein [Burkholderiales bacterium]
MTWSELVLELRDPGSYPSKSACPMIKLAAFGNDATAGGSLRSDANLKTIYGLEGDYDLGQVSVQGAAARLRQAGLAGIIYSSASHTPEAPRWRVLVPLAQPCEPAQRRERMGVLNAILGCGLSPESFTPSQCYYYGRVAGVIYEFEAVDGAALDVDDCHIEPIFPQGDFDTASVPVTDREALEFARHVMLDGITEQTFVDLEDALSLVPADDRDTWIRVGHALASLKSTEHEPRAKALWLAWSAKSAKFDPVADPGRWAGFRADRTGYPAVFNIAKQYGWEGGATKTSGADGITMTLNDAVANLRSQSRDDVLSSWAELATSLPADQQDLLVREVSYLTGVGTRTLNGTLKASKSETVRAIARASVAARAAGRKIIAYRPEDRTEHALEVEQAILQHAPPGSYMQFGGQLARITVRPCVGTRSADQDDPPEIPQIELLDDVAALAEAERVVMFTKTTGDRTTPIAVPADVIDVLLKKRAHTAPSVAGLVTHPIVVPAT